MAIGAYEFQIINIIIISVFVLMVDVQYFIFIIIAPLALFSSVL